MAFDAQAIKWSNLEEAVRLELLSRNRLMPRRWDHVALANEPAAVAAALRPLVRRGPSGRVASIVLVDKDRRGARPLHMMTLVDRVLFRLLVDDLRPALPDHIRERWPIDAFRRAPLGVEGATHVVKTDVTAYFEYIDHEMLRAELLNQTGREPSVDSLMTLLASVHGRLVGIPQVHPCSDVLGDTYLDAVRRRLIRQGHPTFLFADDFRITADSLGRARDALEACSTEVRRLGLVLNERKTLTFRLATYQQSLDTYAEAEARLFEGDDPFGLGFQSSYDEVQTDEPLTLGDQPLGGGLEDNEALTDDNGRDPERDEDIAPERAAAAARAWDVWDEETEADPAIRQSLLGRALPTLGAIGDERPVRALSRLLGREPSLTPEVAVYLEAYANGGPRARMTVRRQIDALVDRDVLSLWQQMWIADIAGGLRRARDTHRYEEWLHECIRSDHPGLAATAAAAIGRIGRGDRASIAECVEKAEPEWRTLAYWGLVGVDADLAERVAENKIDRQLLTAGAGE
jgi:hypothetical protein